jgi:succinoglycan biosynthesis transport protein ExoP
VDTTPPPGLIEAIRRYKRMIVAITLGSVALGIALALVLAPNAVATETVGLVTPSSTSVLVPGTQGDASISRYVSQRALFALSDQSLGVAASKLPGTSVDDLRKEVTITPSTTATSFVVEASAGTASGAIAAVDAVIEAYRSETTKQVMDMTATALDSINADIASLQTTLAKTPSGPEQQAAATTLSSLTREISDIQAQSALFGDGVQFVQAPTDASTVKHRLNSVVLVTCSLIGFLIAVTLAWLRADRDRQLSLPEQAEHILAAPLLGEVQVLRHQDRTQQGYSGVTEALREVTSPLLTHVPQLHLLAVTGAQRQIGVTTTAIGMGAAAAAEGLRVLLVDGDPETNGLATALGISPRRGLLDAQAGEEVSITDLIYNVEVGKEVAFSAMTCGLNTANEALITASGLRSLFDRLLTEFDMIVVDAPNSGTKYLSSVVAGLADGVVVVVPQRASIRPLADLRRSLVLGRAEISGYVFSRRQ